jgi:uncharacterized membrane protein
LTSRRARIAVDGVLLALIAVAALAVAADVPLLRPVTVLLALLLVPGGALLTRWRVADVVTAAGLAVGLSLALEIMLAAALARAHVWEPMAMAAAFAVAATILLVLDLYRATADEPASAA